MDIFATYAADETKEQDGVWHDIGDSSFLIARSGNAKYSKHLSRAYEKNQKALERKDDGADKLAEKLLTETLAHTVLLGWKNVTFKGEQLEYSIENAAMLLSIKDFRKQIVGLAEDFSHYKAVQEAETEKN